MTTQNNRLSQKQWIAVISGIVTAIGSGALGSMEFIESKIQEYSQPAIDKKVYAVLDSTMKAKIEVYHVGMFFDGKRLQYRNVDGLIYTPILDASIGDYYFINEKGETFWCH